jgi:hypothetical protein
VQFAELMGQKELASHTSPYAGVDKQQLVHEWLVIMFWVIHRVPVGCDKERLMGLILKRYFEAAGLMRSKESATAERDLITSRLKEYDNAFVPSSGTQQLLLGGTIAKNFLNQDKPVLNAIVAFAGASDVITMMSVFIEVCKKHRVID